MNDDKVKFYAKQAFMRYKNCKSNFEKFMLEEQIYDTCNATGKANIWKEIFSDYPSISDRFR